MDYEKLYHIMFNAATEAVKKLGSQDHGQARLTLVEAQQRAEAEYVERDEARAL